MENDDAICGSQPSKRSTDRCEIPLSRNHKVCMGPVEGRLGLRKGWVNPNYVKRPKIKRVRQEQMPLVDGMTK